LGVCELDTAFRGLLLTPGRAEVVAAVGHPVAVSQELLPVAKVGLERARLLLRVEPPCFAPGAAGGVEAAQRQLPWPGQHAVRAVEAPAVRLGEELIHNRKHQGQLRLALRRLRHREGGVHLVLPQASRVLLDARLPQPRHHGGSVAVKAADGVCFRSSVLLRDADVLVELPEEVCLP